MQTPPSGLSAFSASGPSLPFSAPGLAMGGELTWTYVWDFKVLTGAT